MMRIGHDRRVVIGGLARAALALGAMPVGRALAQSYPDRPIKWIVPFPPGGALDVLGRIVAQKMSEDLKQQCVIENKPGATGHVGSEQVARAAPNGYTLLFTASSTQVVSAQLMRLNYNPNEDLVPVGLAATLSNIVVVTPSLPVKTFAEFLAYAKANPGRITYASTGVGSNLHLAAELMSTMAGIKMRHIPYSTPQLIPDLLSGRVQMLVGNIPQVKAHIAEGKLTPLAATSAKRLPEYPDLPTVAETLPGYEVNAWGMLLAPKRTPPAIIAALNASLNRALATPDVREAFAKQQFDPAPMTPEGSQAFMQAEWARWSKVIKDAEIPPIAN